MNKAEIRASSLSQRQLLGQHQRNIYSHSIISSLFKHLAEQRINIECLLMYRSMASEVVTDELLGTQDYRLFAPVTQSDAQMQWLEITPTTHWKKGVLGVMEPTDSTAWREQSGASILLCPLSAFDRQGNRLGMGKGCFDTWLSQYGSHIQQVIGLAFSCQEVAQVPAESHDMPMNYVITEKEVMRCTKASQKI